jgi:glucuronate isomerase
MNHFLDENFLLRNQTARRLYFDYAQKMPIIDYHCHLPAGPIAENWRFENLAQVWLYGDHYKWRAMRANGVDESYCTGNKSDWEKFDKWAATVPFTLRNPLYHWTHLELRRYFGVATVLNPQTAKDIYEECNEQLQSDPFRVRSLLRRMGVHALCTTDDPTDSLVFHQQIKKDGFEIAVLPAFRPDAAMNVEDPGAFCEYIRVLEQVAGKTIGSFGDFLEALKQRHDFFSANGCMLSDHGLEEMYADDYTEREVKTIFSKVASGRLLERAEKRKFKSAMLVHFAEWDWEKSWVQQFHLGAMRNNNSRMAADLGKDTGWDSIGDYPQAKSLSKFLDRMDRGNKLARTILYNVNPSDNEVMATMLGNFNDGSTPGKIQWGSAWWFLDQKDGITSQLNVLSNMGLLARFIGMLTDSRSFLSFPRHEYFRRVLCNLFGEEMENGELPNDMNWIGKIISDICYQNAKNYFSWPSFDKKPGDGEPAEQLIQ